MKRPRKLYTPHRRIPRSKLPDVVLVGNGPSALCRRIGGLINQIETVVRFNAFVLNDKVSDWVGTRTDVWAVSPGYFFEDYRLDRAGALKCRVLLCTPLWNGSYKREVFNELASRLPDYPGVDMNFRKLAVEADAFTRKFTKGRREFWLSTGAMALAHFAQAGFRVGLVGFDHFDSSKLHYADKQQFKFGTRHRPDIEAAWFARFKRNTIYL